MNIQIVARKLLKNIELEFIFLFFSNVFKILIKIFIIYNLGGVIKQINYVISILYSILLIVKLLINSIIIARSTFFK